MEAAAEVLAKGAERRAQVQVQRDVPLEIDLGLLSALDPVGISLEDYEAGKERTLERASRDGLQVLLNALFAQPVRNVQDEVIASVPESSTPLPREKPLPKPKPPTKWEQFAKAKGIAPKPRRERLVFDEALQEWVPRWGYGGKNKFDEEQWLSEVPKNADLDYNPQSEARKERKARGLKNEAQRIKNVERAMKSELNTRKQREDADRALTDRGRRQSELEQQLHVSRRSTASMGKFDKTFDGEPRTKGLRRHFAPNERPFSAERGDALRILAKIDPNAASLKRKHMSEDNPDYAARDKALIDQRKAIKRMTNGDGVTALNGKKGRK